MTEITRELIANAIARTMEAESESGKYGNGNPVTFRRTIIDDIEYTLVGEAESVTGMYLYAGRIGATVARIYESGRRHDDTPDRGVCPEYAMLIANNIRSASDFFQTKYGEITGGQANGRNVKGDLL